MPRAASPKVAVSVIVEHDAWRDVIAEPLPLLRRAAAAAVAEERRARRSRSTRTPQVAVALIDDRAMQKLNKTYRGKDKPTNVLSFPSDAPQVAGAPALLGDIAIAYETLAREAAAEKKPFLHHLAHLAAHGYLHLLGYDHQTDSEAEAMEALERETLAAMRIPDPYADAADIV